ncbi:1-phosphofructokinase [Brevibacillus daliensis]|uniref:1-phosphofructokinase n=1 Tax=Brevibacillus daliensis TaxID=2892995 RepID=UPI001E2C69AF|nr:1-phosphofructokinase [Brevibacillus daliensis]
MILTVTCNPSIDCRYNLPSFQKNGVHRSKQLQRTAGGKGLNVSRVLHLLGNSFMSTGFLGGTNGNWILNELNQMGIQHQFVPIQEETRSCLAILTEEPSQTEILEQGPRISQEEKNVFLNVFESLLEKAEWISASGSLPLGLGSDFYLELGKLVRQKGKKFILDSSGESLEMGIMAQPFLIKPNREEFASMFQEEMHNLEQVAKRARELCHRGVQNVLVSLGGDGALLVTDSTILKADIPAIRVVNPVGSGDAMIAGCLHAFANEGSIDEALRYGCATGMANALEEETGKVDPDLVKDLASKVVIRTL